MSQSSEYYKNLLSGADEGETLPLQQNQNNESLVSNDDDIKALLESEGEDVNLFAKTASGDTNVKEDIDMDTKDGSISMVELARRELAGENRKDTENQNPFDGRTKAAKEFLERMNNRRGK